MKKRNYLSIDWHSVFEYNEDSPSGLVWKISTTRSCKVGDYAGSPLFDNKGNEKGWKIGYMGKCYYAHRIIWVMHNGSIDENMHIDHINRNPRDNRISNLRLVPDVLNHRNKSKSRANTSGTTGVGWIVKDGLTSAYAHWSDNGVSKTKNFAVIKYGLIPAWHNAFMVRKEAIERINKSGVAYTDDHGT